MMSTARLLRSTALGKYTRAQLTPLRRGLRAEADAHELGERWRDLFLAGDLCRFRRV